MSAHGVFFALVGKHRRSVYAQFDGEIILGDECKCIVDWPDAGGFAIRRQADCPIDEHQVLRQKMLHTWEAA